MKAPIAQAAAEAAAPKKSKTYFNKTRISVGARFSHAEWYWVPATHYFSHSA
jgi:hypothetical protein